MEKNKLLQLYREWLLKEFAAEFEEEEVAETIDKLVELAELLTAEQILAGGFESITKIGLKTALLEKIVKEAINNGNV